MIQYLLKSIHFLSYRLKMKIEQNRKYFSKYYVPKVQVKDFNVLIDGKSFFSMPVKNGKATYEQIIEMGRNNDYKTGNLLDYEYFSNHYKLIVIDLNPKNCIRKL